MQDVTECNLEDIQGKIEFTELHIFCKYGVKPCNIETGIKNGSLPENELIQDWMELKTLEKLACGIK